MVKTIPLAAITMSLRENKETIIVRMPAIRYTLWMDICSEFSCSISSGSKIAASMQTGI